MLRDVRRIAQTTVIGMACLSLICGGITAQEETGDTGQSEAKSKKADASDSAPSEAKPADDAKSPAPAGKEKPKPAAAKPDAAPKKKTVAPPDLSPADAFAAKLTEWKDVLKDLRKLQADYATAEPSEAAGIESQWGELIAKGEAMILELREAGKQAYVAAPNENDELTEFLVKIVKDDVERDDYETAVELSQALLAGGCEEKELYEPAGIAAFATGDFDKADEYLDKAKDESSLGDDGKKYVDHVDDYKDFWKEEQKLREKEAQTNDLPRVRMTTSKGELVIELFENEAPDTVGNFVSLVEQGYYDGLSFHRVLEGFMAQGGCPRGDGTGGPGYEIYCECDKDGARKHFRGTLSMAHAGRNTGGSQFFLTFLPTPHLNGKHTAFGRVVEGMEVLAKLQRVDPQASGSKPDPDKIVEAKVIRKREHDYKPNKVK